MMLNKGKIGRERILSRLSVRLWDSPIGPDLYFDFWTSVYHFLTPGPTPVKVKLFESPGRAGGLPKCELVKNFLDPGF